MLETTRLSLRPMQESDAEGFFALNSDPEVLQYTGDAPFRDVEEARAFLQGYDAGGKRWVQFEKINFS